MKIPEEVLKLIKKVVLEEAGKLGVEVEKIILFGSRARGDYREESDYDILVVVKKAWWRDVFRLQSRIRVRLLKLLGREVDLIIIDKEWFARRRDVWGSLEYIAVREGVVV
ncbi:MAG: nucleotidyltransferase domain-containing protein [Desulfurococcales archaeon]|nr:nucleotidyltransferase domain-containing protein [Desulfurococcales archaeon]